ncbi:MAG: hypothetical protein Q8P41_01795 [Pseudomonadota bacterium]|nr:hypothetical protein [Pseudomonadota bacterium]
MSWLLALVACTGAYDGPAAAGEGAAVFGRVVSLLGDGLGDVTICAFELEVPCVTSAPDGDFLLEPLPEDADVIVTMEKADHLRTAYLHHTSRTQEWQKTLMPAALVDSMANRVDTEFDPASGHVMFILWAGPDYTTFERVAGVTFAIDAGGAEPFYQGAGGLPDPELDATSTTGSGGAFNLDPGTYTVTFSAEAVTCAPWFSPDFAPGAPFPVPAVAGWASYMDLVCT